MQIKNNVLEHRLATAEADIASLKKNYGALESRIEENEGIIDNNEN